MTVEEANDIRKGVTGRAAFHAWTEFKKSSIETTSDAESLRQWDEQHNFSALRATFGTDEEILSYGVLFKYRSLATNWSTMYYRPDKGGPRVGTLTSRKINGEYIALADLKEEGRDHLINLQKGVIQRAAMRLHFYQKDWGVVRGLINQWLFDLEDEGFKVE